MLAKRMASLSRESPLTARVPKRVRVAHELLRAALKKSGPMLFDLGIMPVELSNCAGFQLRAKLTEGRFVVQNVCGFILAQQFQTMEAGIDRAIFEMINATQPKGDPNVSSPSSGDGSSAGAEEAPSPEPGNVPVHVPGVPSSGQSAECTGSEAQEV